MRPLFILVPVAVTSVLMCGFALAQPGSGWAGLGRAVGRMLEAVGIVLAVLVADLAVGVVTIAVLRGVGLGGPSFYVMSDVTLVPLALAQGLTLHWWLSERPRRVTDARRGKQSS